MKLDVESEPSNHPTAFVVDSTSTVDYDDATGNVTDNSTNPMADTINLPLTLETEAPLIDSVTITNIPHGINDVVTLTVYVQDDDGDQPNVISGTVAGYPLSTGVLTRVDTGTYQINFTISNDDQEILRAADVPVVNLVLQDSTTNRNQNTPFAQNIVQGNDRIDAKYDHFPAQYSTWD